LIKISNCDKQYIYEYPQVDGQALKEKSDFSRISSKLSEIVESAMKNEEVKTLMKDYYCKNNVGQIVPCSNDQNGQEPTFYERGREIQPLPCQHKNGTKGICMFAVNCAEIGGVYLGACIDRLQFGSCCKVTMDQYGVSPLLQTNKKQVTPDLVKKSANVMVKPSEIKVTNRIKVIGTLQSPITNHQYQVDELKDEIADLFSLSRINAKSEDLKKSDY